MLGFLGALLLFAGRLAVQGQFTYITNNGAITITGYTGPGGAVNIPDQINGLPVTAIGNSAFGEKTNLVSVTIPDSVISIGDSAFYRCFNVTSVPIPNRVTNIGDDAFAGCGLTNVSIPNGVSSIGNGVFGGCFNLTGVTIPNSVTSIGDDAFAGCGLTNVTIPNSVFSIGAYAFADSELTSVVIGNGVTYIGDAAFQLCGGLTRVVFIGNAPTVFPNAFTIEVFDPVTYEHAPAYYLRETTGWTNTLAGLPTVMMESPPQFGTTADGWNYASDQVKNTLITGYSGSDDTMLIPSIINGLPVTGIAPYAFYEFFDNTDRMSVTIPDSVTAIGDSAFARGFYLTNVVIGSRVTSIGNYAFESCSGLISVTIPQSVTSLGDYAFADCGSLTRVYFAGNAPTADSSVFYNGGIFGFLLKVYYLPGTLGWSNTFAGLPTALWFLPQPLILRQGPGFGVRSNQFGFTIAWATNGAVVVQAATNLSNPVWVPVATNTLNSGSSYFSDPAWTNFPQRFYRLTTP
jgi:hypothetical protein